ncbi:MAG: ABC transporter ATP-binding protein [Chloroflexota bacterium]
MLKVEGLSVAYGSLRALWDVSLEVNQGELVAIIGSNGAGKTTLLRTISGLLQPMSGTISFLGQRIDALPSHKICEMGLVHIPEGRRLFPLMSVGDNLDMGAYPITARKHRLESLAKVLGVFPLLKDRRHQEAGTLSGGEQQMLAVGRGLMTKPALLMLDEPTLGLSPVLARQILDTLKVLNDQGLTILLISQEVFQSLNIASRAYVIENGRVALEGRACDVLNNELVRSHYLGR